MIRVLLSVLLVITVPSAALCQEITSGLAFDPMGTRGRIPFHEDPLLDQIVKEGVKTPNVGNQIDVKGESSSWYEISADENGWFTGKALRGGYIYADVTVDRAKAVLLDARGHSFVYVNGKLRVGNPYLTGWGKIPVALEKGRNTFLFKCGRGRLSIKLEERAAMAQVIPDYTLPDFRATETEAQWGAVAVANASLRSLDLRILATVDGGETALTLLGRFEKETIRKVGFRIPAPLDRTVGKHELVLRLFAGPELMVTERRTIKVVDDKTPYSKTFRSEIDGSIQYYAVRPALEKKATNALVLSLHGAGVEARGQAGAYGSKTWAHIVAPTNRRPFGFDWEDWGRLDAIEVLEQARDTLEFDRTRVYLTGHSMGGHGTWQLGVLFPGRFAAIGPSAGWASFRSYSGTPKAGENARDKILARATSSSDTLSLLRNLERRAVYILHGDADDNVPVSEARDLKKALDEFHEDVSIYEEPGAGHWWNKSDEAGADCVDWQPMFDLFARRRLPRSNEVRVVDFRTPNPQITNRCHWVSIDRQERSGEISHVNIRHDHHKNRFVGTTRNVTRLTLDLRHAKSGELLVKLDEQEVKLQEEDWPRELSLEKAAQGWKRVTTEDKTKKGAHRAGPFKMAFQNDALLVIGDEGSAEETEWAKAKARYDSETFWYRGNASFDMILSSKFDPSEHPDRNIIIYGHSQMNSAWKVLGKTCPVAVIRGTSMVGEHMFGGPDFSCLFTYPRTDHDSALVGVVCGTGLEGLRLTDRLPYFVSGIGYPDFVIFSPATLITGNDGVHAAGYFDADWQLDATQTFFR